MLQDIAKSVAHLKNFLKTWETSARPLSSCSCFHNPTAECSQQRSLAYCTALGHKNTSLLVCGNWETLTEGLNGLFLGLLQQHLTISTDFCSLTKIKWVEAGQMLPVLYPCNLEFRWNLAEHGRKAKGKSKNESNLLSQKHTVHETSSHSFQLRTPTGPLRIGMSLKSA